ncbi:MAG TPA: phytanoyl-CoA dioxygenase family protein [Chloroflexota bacterium]|nr:phytanoyl-CoA dioxygenase family protein [Chloroflexota bacterium]
MLTKSQVARYWEAGCLVVEAVVTGGTLDRLRRITDEFLERARSLDFTDDVFDLAEDHTPDSPKVRRIQNPECHHRVYAELVRSPAILDVVADLTGPDIRFDHAKLNCKPAGGGAEIEWHQDWAFYPQTNDDMLAVSVMLDDCGPDNGPLLVVPGSHRGPVWDHHFEGRFIGAIDPATPGFDPSPAIPLTGAAGSVTVHHVRAVHGSRESRSDRPRRLLNMNYAAADTWPLLGLESNPALWVPDIEAFHAKTVRGRPTFEPRLTGVPVRLPLPWTDGRTIFEQQRARRGLSFANADAAGS